MMAIVLHLFTGQHSHASTLVLCMGDDGHIAIEVLQHTDHVTVQTHPEICSDAEKCKDILLSLGHDDLLISDVQRDVLSASQAAALRVSDSLIINATPDFLVFAEDFPDADILEHRLYTAQIQTLKHTVLTI